MVNFTHDLEYLMHITEIIGRNIKNARNREGITQKTLAERCGVTTHAITDIEAGRRKPSIDLLFLIGSALKVNSGDLIGSDWQPPPVQIHYREALEKYLLIPERIVELAENFPPGHEVWGIIEDELEEALEDMKAARNSAKGKNA